MSGRLTPRDAVRARGRNRAPMLAAFLVLAAAGCAESPTTIAMHDPIYPAADEKVTFTLDRVKGSKLARVELYESISRVNSDGTIDATGRESLLGSWRSPEDRISLTRGRGYGANSLVRYRFVVRAPSGLWPRTETYTHEVTFATRPYPGSSDVETALPAPVYCVGHPDNAFDIILIPDRDMQDEMPAFRKECGGLIREEFLEEPTLQMFRRSFNFYINSWPGSATTADTIPTQGYHQAPANRENLSFAECLALIHRGPRLDYALYENNLCSIEMGERGTFLHELGHALFALADEYEYGGDHRETPPWPNNWVEEAWAKVAAPYIGKSPSDVCVIRGTDPLWWKMCVDSCQMCTSARTTSYDRPCRNRVVWRVLNNAVN
jgi:hypothetical protein